MIVLRTRTFTGGFLTPSIFTRDTLSCYASRVDLVSVSIMLLVRAWFHFCCGSRLLVLLVWLAEEC